MNSEKKQRSKLETIIQKGYDACNNCNLINDLSSTKYLQKIAQKLVGYYGLEVAPESFKTTTDFLSALDRILRDHFPILGLDTKKLQQLHQNTGNTDVSWKYLAAATMIILQKRQLLPKFVGVRGLANFLSSPR